MQSTFRGVGRLPVTRRIPTETVIMSLWCNSLKRSLCAYSWVHALRVATHKGAQHFKVAYKWIKKQWKFWIYIVFFFLPLVTAAAVVPFSSTLMKTFWTTLSICNASNPLLIPVKSAASEKHCSKPICKHIALKKLVNTHNIYYAMHQNVTFFSGFSRFSVVSMVNLGRYNSISFVSALCRSSVSGVVSSFFSNSGRPVFSFGRMITIENFPPYTTILIQK